MSRAEPWDAERFLHQFAHKGRHDLGAPIRAVQNFTALLKDELGPDTGADVQSYLGFLEESGERLDLLVRRVAELVKMGGQAVEIQPLHLASQFDGQDVDVPAGLSVCGDPRLFATVVRELLDNVARYGAPPVKITCPVPGTILFTDSGEGIAEERLADALSPFYRLVPNTHSPGAGLGLPLCARAMERMNGQLELKSAGEGTGLTVKLLFQQ